MVGAYNNELRVRRTEFKLEREKLRKCIMNDPTILVKFETAIA